MLAAGMHYLVAAALATQVSTGWNLLFTEKLVFKRRDARRSAAARAGLFYAVNNLSLLVRGPMLLVLVGSLAMNAHAANFVSLVALGLLRFMLADAWIWAGFDGKARERAVFLYDVHGLVSVESPVKLRELERFRTAALADRPTIRVHVGKLNTKQSQLVTALSAVRQHLRYDEGLGRTGFAIEIAAGKRIEIVASPLLVRSPHVLYTNVVEPIMRWEFVKRGYALIHAACIAYGDNALLVTARTDTGKTTTVLRLLDNGGATFLSDDLTLMTAEGRVFSYPKPLTISNHTVAAINTPLLSMRERMKLVYQSKVHSRSGRKFAFTITKSKLPVATINAIVQWIIPPPKYDVTRLVPGVELSEQAQVNGLVVIERGGTGENFLRSDEAVDTLIENTEDAYGFPPYAEISPFLRSLNGGDLKDREREIVSAALGRVPARVMRSETLDWSDRIPKVVTLSGPAAPVAAGLAVSQPVVQE
jgi:dolichol-phosphate mannosyltransferase